MPVIVDAMGGDHAPAEVVQGALQAAQEHDLEIVLVGQEDALAAFDLSHPRLRVHHAAEVVGMDEHPAQALKRKRDNSISVGARLAAEAPGSSFVSAGSTGAVMAAALFTWRRISGVERPCIAGILPTMKGASVVADIGANVDCKPGHVAQFAVLCSAYASYMLGAEAPKVGLLNIGSEATKGNEASQAAHQALAELSGIDFVGNVEPQAVYSGEVEVVVTDGFAGNIFLKTSETMSGIFQGALRKAMAQAPDLAARAGELFGDLARFDAARTEYAGAPLLGCNGVAIIVHGAAKADTIANAIRVADRAAQSGFLQHLQETYQKKREAAQHG